MTDEPREWLIYDGRSDLFWRAHSRGYGTLADAGLYPETEAKRIGANPDPNRHDRAHHITKYAEQLRAMQRTLSVLIAALDQAEARQVPAPAPAPPPAPSTTAGDPPRPSPGPCSSGS